MNRLGAYKNLESELKKDASYSLIFDYQDQCVKIKEI